jgi:DNA-binding NtrC family response regulator
VVRARGVPPIRAASAKREDAGFGRDRRAERAEGGHPHLECLREHGNNETSAAKTLGITREGLHKKLRQLGIG